MNDEIVLRYIGKGVSFVPGVPARDLTQADIDVGGFTREQLLAYREVYARTGAADDVSTRLAAQHDASAPRPQPIAKQPTGKGA